MAKNITIKEGSVARNFMGVKKLQTNVIGGGNQLWIPEDEAADYCTFKKITLRQNGTVKAEDNACDGFSEVTVDIPSDTKEKVITQNGEYIATDDNCHGYSKVTVNVAGGGAGGDRHTVIFYASDRVTILEKQTVEDGGGAIYHGATPTSSGMRFIGWTPNPTGVKADMNCYPRFENLIYDPTQIQEDWVTIAQNIKNNPDYYPIGAWKLLETREFPYSEWNDLTKDGITLKSGGMFDPSYILPSQKLKMQLVAKNVEPLDGGNGYAPTTWMSINGIFDTTDIVNVANQTMNHKNRWDKNWLRYFFYDQFTSKMFPLDLLNYLHKVVKYTKVRDEQTQGIESMAFPTVDWFFIPSLREITGGVSDLATAQIDNLGYADPLKDEIETNGAIYDIYCNGTYVNTASNRLMQDWSGNNRAYYLRTSNNTAWYGDNGTSFQVGNDGNVHYLSAAENTACIRLGFCL